MRHSLSVVVITLNAAAHLEQCLQSCNFADEIVVVDSGSTDGTQQIAERHGARFLQQPWLGFGPQKQFAVAQASHDWVLCLDADEWLSIELISNINDILSYPQHESYHFPRCNKFMGRFLRHGEGYPDLCLRLFDRRKANWSDDLVHEYVQSQTKPGRLRGDLMHESGEDIERYLAKQNRYTSLQARQLYERRKRVSVAKMLLSPLIRFFKFYVVRQGWRDGLPGLVHISIGCINSFIKYAKLRELYRLEQQS
ncbi:MAG: glycosyltransferase family 2 protein [Paludibacterium sp.]|uniref:glycosyltransferase family 2 protein n=1 Tax=Paludibacterium sp. TaxID=1917523 RepID=UPI0025D7842F|nr:glycosyltransferase family 2 protein [Paludibacterium sp.]MBV8047627.1 glycosyltransferase family 2 protein [Paludibacterium sp.]MBV8648015.1 glycosyltransferase family 2 protein [Paludibacterium sp.]